MEAHDKARVNRLDLLKHALNGITHQLTVLSAEAVEIQREIRGFNEPIVPAASRKAIANVMEIVHQPAKRGGKRRLSAAARKKIGAAQKKRWAEYHKAQAKEVKKSA